MSLQAFQHALADLTVAPLRARRLAKGDMTILDSYDLDERELSRLLDVLRQPGMSLNCTIARANRFVGIGDVFPMTCVLLDLVLRDLLDELWENARPTNFQFLGEEDDFAEFLRQKMSNNELSIPYLDEIFGYECVCWELAKELRSQTDPDHEASAIVEFHHSPDLLLLPLSEMKAPPDGLPEAVYRAKLTLRGSRFDVEMI